jgi:hypothetical protein
MTNLTDAKVAWHNQKKKFREATPTRTAFLGDGNGYAMSNIVVPDNPSMFFARERMGDRQYFVVPNFNAGINPQFNLPVVIGYDQINPNIEQILGVDMSIFPYQSAASVLGGLGPHHRQHEFGGGDEVFIDPELIKIGLFTPDNPPTLGGYIQPFYYSNKQSGLRAFPGSRIDSVDVYKPTATGATRFLTIAFNPDSGSIVYRAGTDLTAVAATSATFEELLEGGGSVITAGGSAALPTVPGGEIPLATFILTSTTASLNWSSTNSSYYHSRLFLGKVDTDIYARLESLERQAKITTLPTTGAAKYSSITDNSIHDGDLRIGRINDRQWTGTSSPSWGNKLFFSGALGTGSWNSENSDHLWMARYNADDNISYLRISLGDDTGPQYVDGLQIGTTSLGGVYNPIFSFYTDGTTIGQDNKKTETSTSTSSISNDVGTHFCNSSANYTLTLPANTLGKATTVINKGAGVVTLIPLSGSISGGSSVSISQYDVALLFGDGTNWY